MGSEELNQKKLIGRINLGDYLEIRYKIIENRLSMQLNIPENKENRRKSSPSEDFQRTNYASVELNQLNQRLHSINSNKYH